MLILILGVLMLSILAFISPIYQEMGELTPTELTTIDAPATSAPPHTPVPLPEETTVSSEDIGYTDQIIFWSMVLVMIILVATLRETAIRKGRQTLDDEQHRSS